MAGAGNSVIDGIHPLPNQNTGGDGPASGQLVQFAVLFVVPIDLPADHYFIVPQVEVPPSGVRALPATPARGARHF